MTLNDSTAGCPRCGGLAACWCPPASTSAPVSPDQVQALREEYAYDNNEDNNEMAPEDAGRWAARIPQLLDALESATESCPDCVYCGVHRQRGDTAV